MDTPFPAYQGDDPFIFVCYAHDDADAVYPEIAWLRDQGINIWYDEGISAGRNWRAEIGSAIRRAERVLFYVSERSLTSDHCGREINFALDEHKDILPVYLADVSLTTDLQVGLSRVQALHRYQDVRYQKHLLAALHSPVGQTIAAPGVARSSSPPTSGTHWKHVAAAVLTSLVILLAIGLWWLAPTLGGAASEAIVSLVIKPFESDQPADDSQTRPGLTYELQRRLSASSGLLVRVDDSPGARADYLLNGSSVGGILQISLRDRNGVTLASWTEPESEDLSRVADTMTRNILIKLGRAADVVTRFEVDLPPNAFRLYLTASSLIRRSHTEESINRAEELFKQVLDAEPRYSPALAGLCSTYLNRYLNTYEEESFRLAEQSCHRAQTLDDENAEVHIALGTLYRESDQEAKAIGSYQRALNLAPYSTDAMRGLGQTYARTDSLDEAERWLRSSIEIEPNHWENYQALGNFQFSQARFEEAAESYQAAYALAPDEPAPLNNVGAAYFMSGRFAEAAEHWELGITMEASPQMFANIGSSYFYAGDFEKSVSMYRQASEMAPDDHRYLGNLGDALHAQSSPEADAVFQRAIQLARNKLAIDPSDIATISSLAAYHAALGNRKIVEQIVKRIAIEDSDNVDVIYNLAVSLDRLGEFERASAMLEELLALGYSSLMLSRDSNFDDPIYVRLIGDE